MAREQQKLLVISTANVITGSDLQQICRCWQKLSLICVCGAFGRGRYVCPRNMAVIGAAEGEQIDLMLLEDKTDVTASERDTVRQLRMILPLSAGAACATTIKHPFRTACGAKSSTDKLSSCLGRNCQCVSRCPFFLGVKLKVWMWWLPTMRW